VAKEGQMDSNEGRKTVSHHHGLAHASYLSAIAFCTLASPYLHLYSVNQTRKRVLTSAKGTRKNAPDNASQAWRSANYIPELVCTTYLSAMDSSLSRTQTRGLGPLSSSLPATHRNSPFYELISAQTATSNLKRNSTGSVEQLAQEGVLRMHWLEEQNSWHEGQV